MSDIDGKTNIRYFVMNMEHDDYDAMIEHYTLLHTNKEAGNRLTVIPNIANTQAIVKVVAHADWIAEQQSNMAEDEESGLCINSYTYDQLNQVHDLLRSSDWPQEKE